MGRKVRGNRDGPPCTFSNGSAFGRSELVERLASARLAERCTTSSDPEDEDDEDDRQDVRMTCMCIGQLGR